MNRLRGEAEPFALATVVRTISVTAAKAGAKAIIARDGSIVGGWIGGGCARSAVIKAAKGSIEDGETRLISIQPEDLLAELGVESGEQREGVQFAKNMCPSQGTMDIFVEPVLPRPALAIFGSSPVAVALAQQAPSIGFDITICAPVEDQSAFRDTENLLDGFDIPLNSNSERYFIVSTQGRGDLAALEAALNADAKHVAFVGSRRKIASLKEKLGEKGFEESTLSRLHGPAGLDLGAITPEEIALSILAELLMVRRMGQRSSNIQHV
ncbi:MAG: XdhC/CoxI family protein [Roseibium sp.]